MSNMISTLTFGSMSLEVSRNVNGRYRESERPDTLGRFLKTISLMEQGSQDSERGAEDVGMS